MADNALAALAGMIAYEQRRVVAKVAALRHCKRPVCAGAEDGAFIQIGNMQIIAAVMRVAHKNVFRSRIACACHGGIDIARHKLAGIVIFRMPWHDLRQLVNTGNSFRVHTDINSHTSTLPVQIQFCIAIFDKTFYKTINCMLKL